MINVLLLSLACTGASDSEKPDSTPESNYFHIGDGPAGLVRMVNTCAPNDGSAVEFQIGLAEATCTADWASDATLRMDVDGPFTGLDPGSYTAWGIWFDPDGDGAPVDGAAGGVVITRVDGDFYEGSYSFTGGGQTYTGEFGALHCYGDVLCG